MTIAKHNAKFGSSEVMLNLERMALKKGTIQPDVVVKTAAKKESFEASGDLQADMLKLAQGLRARGYANEADVLEDRIFTHKRAADMWYDVSGESGEDLLEFAHPDGDVTIGDSEYGKVETILSTQKKIREKIEKVPTGKYAKLTKRANEVPAVPELELVNKTMYGALYHMLDTEEIDIIGWGGKTGHFITDDGEAKAYAEKATGPVHSYLQQKRQDFKANPVELLSLIKMQSIKYYSQKGPWQDSTAFGEGIIHFDILLGAMFKGNIPLMSLLTKKPWEEESKEKEKEEEEEKKSKEVKKTVFDDFAVKHIKHLNVMISWFGKYLAANPKDSDKRKIYHEFVRARNALQSKSKGRIFDDIKKALYHIFGAKATDAVDISELAGLLKEQYRRFNEFTKKIAKKGSVKMAQDAPRSKPTGGDDVPTPAGDPSGPSGGMPPSTSPKPKPIGHRPTGTGVVLRIQQALQGVAKALKDAGHTVVPKTISNLENTGMDGLSGPKTNTALSTAEKVRVDGKLENLSKIEVQYNDTTLKNVQELSKAIRSGGAAYTPDGKSVGTYEVRGEPVQLSSRDVGSLGGFMGMLERTGLIVEFAGAGSSVVRQPTISESSSAATQQARKNVPTTASLQSSLKVIAQTIPDTPLDPWASGEKPDVKGRTPGGKATPAPTPGLESQFQVQQEVGMSVQEWWTALSEFEQAALTMWRDKNVEGKARQQAGRTAQAITTLKRRMLAAAKKQGITQGNDPRKVQVVGGAYPLPTGALGPSGMGGQPGGAGGYGPWGYGQQAGQGQVGQVGEGAQAMVPPISSDINFNHPIWQNVLMNVSHDPVIYALQQEGVINWNQWRNTPASTLALNYAPASEPDVLMSFIRSIAGLIGMMRQVRREYAGQVGQNPNAARLIKSVSSWSNRWVQLLQAKMRQVIAQKKKMGPMQAAR